MLTARGWGGRAEFQLRLVSCKKEDGDARNVPADSAPYRGTKMMAKIIFPRFIRLTFMGMVLTCYVAGLS